MLIVAVATTINGHAGIRLMKTTSRGMTWLRFVDLGTYLGLAVVAGMRWRGDRHHWIGAAISIPAFFLWMLARYQIGDSFAVLAEARKLVTHGIYSKIRHPIYVFG